MMILISYVFSSSPMVPNLGSLTLCWARTNVSRSKKIDINMCSHLEEFRIKYEPIYCEISKGALKVFLQFVST